MSEVTLTREELNEFVARLRRSASENPTPGDFSAGYAMAQESTADALEELLDSKDDEAAKAEADAEHFEKNKKLFFIVDAKDNRVVGTRFALTSNAAVMLFTEDHPKARGAFIALSEGDLEKKQSGRA